MVLQRSVEGRGAVVWGYAVEVGDLVTVEIDGDETATQAFQGKYQQSIRLDKHNLKCYEQVSVFLEPQEPANNNNNNKLYLYSVFS